MLVERQLLRENITFSVAKEKDVNILHQLSYRSRRDEFFKFINERRSLAAKLAAHHLGVPPKACHAVEIDNWMSGSFNLCVLVTIKGFKPVIIRFPLPYRVGEGPFPGNSDEKVKCEAGAYAWLQQECPLVPIPKLYGFALSTGQCFTDVEQLPLLPRLFHRLRRWYLSFVGLPVPTRFVQHKHRLSKELHPYLIIEYMEEGEMLSVSMQDQYDRKELRKNLFRDLSKIMLSLSRVPLPKIGSFVIDDSGFLRLTNRPLTFMLQDLENENIPVDMPRDRTFASVDSYVNSLLVCHDNRLTYQPNGISSGGDCVSQMTALALMRTIRPEYFDSRLNHGPFFFSLTDIHASNILVDENWNIKSIIDLEWAAALPVEFIGTPLWLTQESIDCINAEKYDQIRQEFMGIFIEEEKHCPADHAIQRASTMQKSWEQGIFWYVAGLESPTGLHSIFYKRLQPLYDKKHAQNTDFLLMACEYWRRNAMDFIRSRMKDKKAYDERLREAFEEH
ncbi:hypothetical protein D8B26_005058 [Coccidioides posadasii str. Silveira]|uniref:Uncharacterized protein n=2 Tax=Coccidioides posadasii TaxID=199306 RepID=E9D5N1_COCPS|nr:conserved hypothetical protein [Coccidioides posadasii str. Silveira]QVM10397.1 hypothetical protein D8B26_005058 [Coccidioides posadasii str. Silveira]